MLAMYGYGPTLTINDGVSLISSKLGDAVVIEDTSGVIIGFSPIAM